jgi:predicted RNA-binding protein with RPS1 domain
MGGSGAKNRRKAQRLSEGDTLGAVIGQGGTAHPAKSSSKSAPPTERRGPAPPRGTTRGEAFHPAPTSSKKKSKKPKHLKRKLAATETGDDRERLEHELKEFERKKSNLGGPPAKKARPADEIERILNAARAKPKVETKESRPSASTVEISEEDAMKKGEAKTKQKKPNQDEPKAVVPKVKTETKAKRPSASTVEVATKDVKKEAETKTKQKEPDQSGPPSKKAKPSLESKGIPIIASKSTKKEATAVSPKDKKENESSASPVVVATQEEKKPAKAPAAKPSPATKSLMQKDDDDDSSDSDSDSDAEEQTRQRGKRRRGRKDTSKQILDEAPEVPSETDEPKDPKAPDPAKKTMKKDDKRKCVGRKPVTEFLIGEKYDAKVVYIKPFGIFLDMGAHSDAFCHVSRLQDDFVDSPNVLYKEGDTVSARVVEIDRRKKRITVSLQSEAKMADELLSVEAHAKRREKHRNAHKKAQSTMEETEPESYEEPEEKPVVYQPSTIRPLPTKPESEMNPAELKRARKLARRAERRENVANE